MAMGVPHYYKDGKPLGAGGMGQYHKMKDGTLHSGKTHTKSSKRLFHFNELSKRYSKRNGGYSRVLKAGFRTGDDAPMAVIELVDRNPEAKKVDKPKKTETKDKKKEALSEPKIAKK